MYFFYFFPLGLDGTRSRRPVLSWALMATMAVAFLWLHYAPGLTRLNPWTLVYYPGDRRAWTALTAVFLHGSWLHLLGNVAYLHVFAPPLEDRLGRGAFLGVFLVLGVGGNLVHGLFAALDLLGQGGLGVLGASGAIAGLLAMSLVRFHSARVEVAWWLLAPLAGQNRAGKTPVPVAAAVGLWLLLQVVEASLARETGATVSFGAHLGGFALGLLLALLLGQRRAGGAEAAARRARSYQRAGNFYAAAGAWSEYLARSPDDLEGRLELARALKITGQHAAAADAFGRVYRAQLARKRIDLALRVHDEARRAHADGFLTPPEMTALARYKEMQLDDAGALEVYEQLYRQHPAHPHGQRALVRVVILHHGRLADDDGARRWLAEAWRHLAPGTWRDFLQREFNLAAAGREAVAADPAARRPAAGS